MTKKKYQRYSSEFKRLALRRASEDGVTDKGGALLIRRNDKIDPFLHAMTGCTRHDILVIYC